MKLLKPMIGTAFIAGLLGMFLSMVALESGALRGSIYWVLVFSSGLLSGGAIFAAKKVAEREYTKSEQKMLEEKKPERKIS